MPVFYMSFPFSQKKFKIPFQNFRIKIEIIVSFINEFVESFMTVNSVFK